MELSFVQIETDRLFLKGITNQQMHYMFENWSKEELFDFFDFRSEEAYEMQVYKHQHGYSTYNRHFLAFLMIEKTTGRVIGRCGIHNWNKTEKRAEIGYAMEDETKKRQGFMSEAVKAIINYCFDDLQLHRLEALVGVENEPSLKIIRKNGFLKEGLLREHYWNGERYVDTLMFGRLRFEV